MYTTYEMDGSGYTPHLWDDRQQAQAWTMVYRPKRMYALAQDLRGRCRPAIDHRGEYDERVEARRAQLLERDEDGTPAARGQVIKAEASSLIPQPSSFGKE